MATDATGALEELVRSAMAAGFACIAERAARGEVDHSQPLTDALDDFPRQFLSIRADLVDNLKAERDVE